MEALYCSKTLIYQSTKRHDLLILTTARTSNHISLYPYVSSLFIIPTCLKFCISQKMLSYYSIFVVIFETGVQVSRQTFYLCLSAVCTCVCGYWNARAENCSTAKHHIGILNENRRRIRAGMPGRWTSKMRSVCFRFRTRALISSPTCTAM